MRFLGLLTSGKLTALGTLVAVLGIYGSSGGKMFSTGALREQHRGRQALGGVSSHAEIAGKCGACHPPAWSRETMASRCLDCHANVRAQLDEERAMHGRIPNGRDCRRCHTEHKGPHAALTDMAEFDHHWTNFTLTGKHLEVECRACHQAESFDNHVGKSHACVSCHADPAIHKGRFGTRCEQCHTTASFSGAVFKHRFPVNHGSKRRGNSCSTCHQDESNYKSYTCYGCHEHQPAKIERLHVRKRIVNFQNCTECHGGGRKKDRRQAEASDAVDRWLGSTVEASALPGVENLP